MALISEINNLRAELHSLRGNMDDLESALGLRRSSVTPAEAQSKLDRAIIKLDQLQKQQQAQLDVSVDCGFRARRLLGSCAVMC